MDVLVNQCQWFAAKTNDVLMFLARVMNAAVLALFPRAARGGGRPRGGAPEAESSAQARLWHFPIDGKLVKPFHRKGRTVPRGPRELSIFTSYGEGARVPTALPCPFAVH